MTTNEVRKPRILNAVAHYVVAELQPHGDVLVMFEDGTVRGYSSEAQMLRVLKARDTREAKRLTNAAVMTHIEWRS